MGIITKNNFKNLKYLNNCDLINRYNLKNSHAIVTLNKIKLSFPLRKFIHALEIKGKNLVYLYKIPYLCLSLYFSKYLKIKYNAIDQEYTLEVLITNTQAMNHFLFLIFIENQNWFNNFNGLMCTVQTHISIICYTYRFPALLLNGIQEIILLFFPEINLKKLFLYINFFFSHAKGFYVPQNFLSTLPFFCGMNFISCDTF